MYRQMFKSIYNIDKIWLDSCRIFSAVFRKYVAYNYIAIRMFSYSFNAQFYHDHICEKKPFKYKIIVIFKNPVCFFFKQCCQI